MTASFSMRQTLFYPTVLCLALTLAFQGAGLFFSPTQAFWLTQNSVVTVDLSTSRIVASHPVKAGAASKIVSSGPFVFLQGDRAVQVLEAQTLKRAHVITFNAEVHDIAASGSLLLVAAGSQIHIVRITSDGQGSILKSLQLPKAAHALTARGTSVYVIDNVVTPFYSHFIDVRDPTAPRLTTMKWGDVYGRLDSQAVADRWYVRQSYQRGFGNRRGYRLWALSPEPPIEKLGRWEMDEGVREFRVHAETLYWIRGGGDDRVWLFRRRLQPAEAATEKVIPLGSFEWVGPRTLDAIELVFSRLYVAVARQFLAFDLDPARQPVRVLRVRSPSPILSFSLQVLPQR